MTPPIGFIEIEPSGDVLVLKITAPALNDFDIAHAVAGQIEEAIRDSSTRQIVINMTNVELITSLGLVVFVRVRKTAAELNARVALCCVRDVVAQVLTLSRLAAEEPSEPGQFTLAPDLDTAMNAVGAMD